MANPWNPYHEPCKISDHLHERKYQHNSFLRNLTRRNQDRNTYPNHPDVDISDAVTYYLLEVEVPGVKDLTCIQVYRSSPRGLTITGSTSRPWDITEAGIAPADVKDNISYVVNGPVRKHVRAHKEDQDAKVDLIVDAYVPPRLMVGERRIGSFRRDFHFSTSVDMGNITCNLEAGLLQVKLPKKNDISFESNGRLTVDL
jgi:HSP20 family molecular chaperone IbpA